MFTNSSVGRLGLLLSILVLTNGCAVGEIGDSAGEPRLDLGFDDAGLTCPGVSADVSASDGWESKQASQPAPDSLYFEVMARPAEANLDALVAVGAQDIYDFSDAAITVRFSETGLVDVMDDVEYSSDGSFEYDAGVWYNIAISADVTARTYDVEVGRCGEKRRRVIRGARFRSAANVYDQLNTWGVWSSRLASLELSTPTWMASGTCAPATCETLGSDCGQRSDGCNRTLNCGVCGGGQLCSSGACVDESVSVPPPQTCTPASCQSLGAECGAPSDGCGGTLNCGGCDAGQLCSNNVCVDQPMTPPPPACVPTTCQALGAECGVRSNGCGGTLNCGGCDAGQSCSNSLCIDPPVTPPPPACVPTTCQALGAECGARSDGCGGTLNCGGCGGTDTCNGDFCVACIPDCAGKECGGDGCGGSCGTCGGSDSCNNISGLCVSDAGGMPTIFWSDELQTGSCSSNYGFDEWLCELNDGGQTPFSSCTGALTQGDNECDLSREADPAPGGSGFAMRQVANICRNSETRSEAGLYFWSGHSALMSHLSTGDPVFVTQDVYIPSSMPSANGDATPWLSLMDFHSDGWHTNPGVFVDSDAAGQFRTGWGVAPNSDSGFSNPGYTLPTNQWFKMEFEWAWKTSGVAVRIWINGNLAHEQTGLKTKQSGHSQPAFYFKVYGTDYGYTSWSSCPMVLYRRNMKITDARIP